MENQKKQNNAETWYLLDAKGKTLGRISTKIANVLRGKDKVDFSPNADNGDYVVVINAGDVVLTGKKVEQKRYYKHSGYLGNLKVSTVPEILKTKPTDILLHSVTGMLPNNKLRNRFLKRLKIFAGAEHDFSNIKFKDLE